MQQLNQNAFRIVNRLIDKIGSESYLGKALSLLIDILNPELIILGSIYGRAHSLLEAAMREVLEKETIRASYEACKIIPAGLAEDIGDMAALSLAVLDGI